MITLHADIGYPGNFIIGLNNRYLFTNARSYSQWIKHLLIGSAGWDYESNIHRFGPLLTTFDPATFNVSTLSVYTEEYIHEHFPEFFI